MSLDWPSAPAPITARTPVHPHPISSSPPPNNRRLIIIARQFGNTAPPTTHTHQDRFLSIAFITAAIYIWNEEDNESIRNTKKPKIYANPNKCDIIFRSVERSEGIRIQSRWDFPINFAIGAIGKYLTFHNLSHNCRTESRSFILLSIPFLDLQICLRFESAEVLHFSSVSSAFRCLWWKTAARQRVSSRKLTHVAVHHQPHPTIMCRSWASDRAARSR